MLFKVIIDKLQEKVLALKYLKIHEIQSLYPFSLKVFSQNQILDDKVIKINSQYELIWEERLHRSSVIFFFGFFEFMEKNISKISMICT